LFFASKWAAAEPLIQLLSIGFAFDASSWAAGALLAARGEFRRGFVYTSFEAPIFLIAIVIGAFSHGAVGVALAVAGYYALVQPIFCYFVFARVGAVGWRDIAKIYAAPVVFGVLTTVGAALLSRGLQIPAWLQLGMIPATAMALYVPAIRAFCPKSYRLLRDRALALRDRSAAG
jgi:O-antigen/teichoic acid export membrane protein